MAAPESTLRFRVSADDTALTLGSGSLPVLATPRLLAWMEAATVDCARQLPECAVDPGLTSVGTRVTLTHDRACGIGALVEVTARLVSQDGRLLQCEAQATMDDQVPIAHASITRVLVTSDRFMARLTPTSDPDGTSV